MKRSILFVIIAALIAGPAPVDAATISGTLVNVATYVTGDATASTLNMGAMMGANGHMAGANTGMMTNGGYGGMMNGAQGSGMYGCRSDLGLLAPNGDLYLLVTESANSSTAGLCRDLGQRVTIDGAVFTKGGIRVLRVDTIDTTP